MSDETGTSIALTSLVTGSIFPADFGVGGGGGSLSPQLHVLQAQAMHPEETLLRWGGRKNHRIMELKMSRGRF